MDVLLLVLAAFACADVFACGALLVAVWVVYRRDASAPPFPVRTCLGVGLVLLLGLAAVYGLVWLALRSAP